MRKLKARFSDDRGMTTAEYAVGTVAVAGLGGLFIKLLTSDAVRDHGSVTLEAALMLPVLLLVAATLMWAMGVAFTALAMGDAARTSARLIARGEPADAVMTHLQESLPDSELSFESRGVDIVIRAERFMSVPIPVFSGVGFTLTQSASAPLESAG